MKIIEKGTVVQFSCNACNCKFVAGINVVSTPDKGENYYADCPMCGSEVHADCTSVKQGDVSAKDIIAAINKEI